MHIVTMPWIRDTDSSCVSITVAQIIWYVTLLFCSHVYIDIYVLIVPWILGISLLSMLTTRVYMHVLFLSSCHMDHHAYYMYYCSMFPYSWYMIVSCYWYGYSRYWTWELLRCDMWTSTSIVPDILFPIPVILFYDINRALVQLSCYPYHVQ